MGIKNKNNKKKLSICNLIPILKNTDPILFLEEESRLFRLRNKKISLSNYKEDTMKDEQEEIMKHEQEERYEKEKEIIQNIIQQKLMFLKQKLLLISKLKDLFEPRYFLNISNNKNLFVYSRNLEYKLKKIIKLIEKIQLKANSKLYILFSLYEEISELEKDINNYDKNITDEDLEDLKLFY
ncbi:hypothetical protein AXA84_0118 [Candidatus Phytoplasma oryzae]|nr:hypothetical protein AXA84_0118 [Candidatus Phytoplasma oryzae]